MTCFRIKPSLVATPISEHVSFSDEGPLLETLEFFEINHGSYQPFNFLLQDTVILFPVGFPLELFTSFRKAN